MRFAALVAVAAACGDNTTITVGFPQGALAFATYKADGGWHHPEQTPAGYRIDRPGPYQFVWVCAQNGAFDVEELFADTSDGDQSVFPVEGSACYPDGGPVVTSALGRISGTVVQAGNLEVGGAGAYSATPNWTYDFEAVQGTHDLDAARATFKVTAHRDHGCYGTFVSHNAYAPVWGLKCS